VRSADGRGRRPYKRFWQSLLDHLLPSSWRTSQGMPFWQRVLLCAVLLILALVSVVAVATAGSYIANNLQALQAPVPTHAPPATSTALPTPRVPAVRVTENELNCGRHDNLAISFVGEQPPAGFQFWVFAKARDGISYFPSAPPTFVHSQQNYQAIIFTGPADKYDLYIVLVPAHSVSVIIDYIEARKLDLRWSRGMSLPTDAAVLERVEVEKRCRSRFDTSATDHSDLGTPIKPAGPK
jgi:hypothetical protein